jgi:hypothetical protein
MRTVSPASVHVEAIFEPQRVTCLHAIGCWGQWYLVTLSMLPIVTDTRLYLLPRSAQVLPELGNQLAAWEDVSLLDMYTMGSTRAVRPVERCGRGGSDKGIAPRMGSLRQSVAMRGVVGEGRSTVRSIIINTTLRAVPSTARPGTST